MGRQGCNTPSDLHLKHLNQHLKGSFMQLHSHATNHKQVDIIMLNILNAFRSIVVVQDFYRLLENKCDPLSENLLFLQTKESTKIH